MPGQQLPYLGIARDRRVAHGHQRVLAIGVPQPLLHDRAIRPSVEQMRRDRLPQGLQALRGAR
jgi:hypothetical protein